MLRRPPTILKMTNEDVQQYKDMCQSRLESQANKSSTSSDGGSKSIVDRVMSKEDRDRRLGIGERR